MSTVKVDNLQTDVRTICIDKITEVVNTINELKALSVPTGTGDFYVNVLGYYERGDGGGGIYYWDKDEAVTNDNNGTIIVDNGATGCWKMDFDGTINVKWFGAKGDGVTDDTSAIQKAIDAGVRIYLPGGTYMLSSEIKADKTGFKLFGESEGTVTIKASDAFTGSIMLNLGNGTVSRYFNEVRNISFFGNSITDLIGIYLNRVNNQSKITHCHFEDFNGGTVSAAIKAVNLALANVVEFNKFGPSLNTNDIWLEGAAGNSWLIEGNYLASGGRVYLDDSMTDVKIVNNAFDGESIVFSDGVSGARGIHIRGNRFEGATTPIQLGLIRGCFISDNFFQGNGGGDRAIDLQSSSSVQYATICNNFFENYVVNYVKSALPSDRLSLYGNNFNDSYTVSGDEYDVGNTKTVVNGTMESETIDIVDTITTTSDILNLSASGINFNDRFTKQGIEKGLTGDGTTDNIFTITHDASRGSYTVIVDVHIDFTTNSTAVSAGHTRYSWTHITDNAVNSLDGAITTEKTLSVVSDAESSRDIDGVTATIDTTSNTVSTFQLAVDTTGLTSGLSCHCIVKIIYDQYSTRPSIDVV